LQKRISSIELTGKEDIEGAILDTREQIASLRHKNKEIQQKSKEIGCSIEAGDEVFGDIKKLEVELSITERKKSKLEARWKEITDNLEKVRKNIG
jgi:predicted nuclease with TOPRIM domain